jgi:hypothetical protein
MIKIKSHLISVLILVVICVSAPAAEPNEPGAASKFMAGEEPNQLKTELTFEISKKERQLGIIDELSKVKFKNYVKPKYVAMFSMSDLTRFYNGPDPITRDMVMTKMILSTSAGRSMSEMQKELLKAGKVFSFFSVKAGSKKFGRFLRTVREIEIGLYAFNVDDAKLITRAFIETMNKKAREKLPPLLDKFMNERRQRLQESRERIADIKNKLAEKEPELNSADSAYKTLKNTDRYKILADTEAYEKAKAAIVQMNEMLSILDIELAGIREKLNVIEQYRKLANFSKATLDKLEQMFVEQMIELRGAEARKEAAVKLRDQDKQFCDLYDAWTGLGSGVGILRSNLEDNERRARFCEEEIANPPSELLPPKVLQNKVTIYPVLAEE